MSAFEQSSKAGPRYYLWLVAGGLIAATTAFSHAQLPAQEQFSATFFTRWMMLGMLITGTAMAMVDPSRWRFWGVVVGLFPVSAVVVYMVLRGPGNIWPIALAMAFTIGLVPAFAGAALGRGLRRLARGKPAGEC